MPQDITALFFDKCPSEEKDVSLWEVYYKMDKLWNFRREAGAEEAMLPPVYDKKVPDTCSEDMSQGLQTLVDSINQGYAELTYIRDQLPFVERIKSLMELDLKKEQTTGGN